MATHSNHKHSGVNSELYWKAFPNDRVKTVDGEGIVASVSDGFAPDTEKYEIVLSAGGGGEYSSSEILEVLNNTGISTSASALPEKLYHATWEPNFNGIVNKGLKAGTYFANKLDYAVGFVAMRPGEYKGMVWKRFPDKDGNYIDFQVPDYEYHDTIAVFSIRVSKLDKSLIKESWDHSPSYFPSDLLSYTYEGDIKGYELDFEGYYHNPSAPTTASLRTTSARTHGLELAPLGSQHTAADDYPELNEILWDRPDLIDAEPVGSGMLSLSKLASVQRKIAISPKEFREQFGTPHRDWRNSDPNRTPAQYQTAQELVDDPNTPWWWRKIVGPAVERYEESAGLKYDMVNAPSRDWCRFRRDSQCYYPRNLDEYATAQAGYPVWIPENRGQCPRTPWNLQKQCDMAEPGPNSREKVVYPDATIPWSAGGQRIPGGARRVASLYKSSSWRDVQAKAKRIRKNGFVRILAVSGGVITAQVKGDSNIYETSISRVPGTTQVALWSCGCDWSTYSWGRSGRWKKYEGRMCSHALAVMYEAQAREMFGGELTSENIDPNWLTQKPVQERRTTPGEWRLDVAASLDSHIEAIDSRRLAVLADTSLSDAEQSEALGQLASASSMMRLDRVAIFSSPVEPLDSVGQIPESAVALNFPVQYMGEICTVLGVNPDTHTCMLLEHGEVPTHACSHPSYDSASGLRLKDDAIPVAIEARKTAKDQVVEDSVEEEPVEEEPAVQSESMLNEEPEPALPVAEAFEDGDEYALEDESPVDKADDIEMVSSHANLSPGNPSLEWLMSGSSKTGSNDTSDIASAAKDFLAKVAVREFSPSEQADIIGEGEGDRAKNLDLLQIEGTHYQSISDDQQDDQFLW